MKKQKSFSLIEVLIVVTIFTLFAGALISLVTVGSKNAVISKHRLQAADLGREGIEGATATRDKAWTDGRDWAYISNPPPGDCYRLNASTNYKRLVYPWGTSCNYWRLGEDGLTNPSNPEDPGFKVTKDSVDYFRRILVTDLDSVGVPQTKKITTEVSWKDFGQNKSIKLIKYLTNWKDATTAGGGGPGGPTVVTEQVGESSDDIEYRWNISGYYFSLTQSWTGAGFWNFEQKKFSGAFRFQTVAVPQGATITSAYLKITAGETNAVTTVNSKIRAEDVDDAATFSTQADFESRFPSQVTTAIVNWVSISNWVYNTEYTSPDIKIVIQEVVDRSNWASNNNMVVFWDDYDNRSSQVANAARRGYSYDGNSAKAAKLIISYTVP